MFYAHFVLAKKGPLAKIWLAAHWDKKLTKAHVFETNIEKSVDGILKPKVKMALRTSGHLLLGVVRIYSRKAKYLLQDCNEAFVKIKMAFRPGMVDLPEEHREAAMNAITLPEVFHDFDTAMPELNEVDIEAQFSLNQSRAEEITMREDYGSLNLVTHDDGFGDMGFDTDNPDIMREAIGNEGMEQSNLVFADGSSLELSGKDPVRAAPSSSRAAPLSLHGHELEHEPDHSDQRMEPAPHAMDDGFGGTIGEVHDDFGPAGGLFEGDLFGSVGGSVAGVGGATRSLQAEIDAGVSEADAGAADAPDSDNEMGDQYDDMPADTHHSWDASPPPPTDAEVMPPPAPPEPEPPRPMEVEEPDVAPTPAGAETPRPPSPAMDHTTLLHNDEESFALAPVDATVLKGITKTKRKRKLIVDEVKNISGEEMKNQLSNTSDIVTTLDLAPPTRRLMHWKETGGVEKLFTLPARQIPSTVLFKKYQRNMTLRSDEETEAAAARPAAAAPADLADREPTQTRRHPRKRRLDESLVAPETPAPQPDLEPPTPVPHDYEPSVAAEKGAPASPASPAPAHTLAPPTPAHDELEPPNTPGMLSALGAPMTGALGALTPGALIQGGLTPGGLQHGGLTPGGALSPALHHGAGDVPQPDLSLHHPGMTPGGMTPGLGLDTSLQHTMTPGGLDHGGLQHSGLTPGGLAHGGMTPAGLTHGGMTPAGLGHGGMTPAGLGHGGMTPVGLGHGGMTPAGLAHGGMTPAGLVHGGMTPAGLGHGGMTPAGLVHGGMTPAGLGHGGMTPAGLTHGGMTPAGLTHGGMTPTGLSHGDQSGTHPALIHGSGRAMLGAPLHDPVLHGLTEQYRESSLHMTNLGYEEGQHSPQHDYDLPTTPENTEDREREAGETEEQFEERVLNRRAAQLFAALRPRLLQGRVFTFHDLAPTHNNRKQVAQKFYSLLVLKKHQVLKLEQHETYGPITIHKGVEFETDAL